MGRILQSRYPASSQHRHMFWHVKYRTTMVQHQDHWFTNTDEQLMAEYIARHKDQLPRQELEDIKDTCEYGCSGPRLHPPHQEHSEDAAKEAERRIDDDFKSLTEACSTPRIMMKNILTGSSPQFPLMFWNLGNWCRKRFDKCPLPER